LDAPIGISRSRPVVRAGRGIVDLKPVVVKIFSFPQRSRIPDIQEIEHVFPAARKFIRGVVLAIFFTALPGRIKNSRKQIKRIRRGDAAKAWLRDRKSFQNAPGQPVLEPC